ncbi:MULTISPECIES: hypothetical protein [Blautia]|uniref:hypothetical protein n=1 Tax=Blautia TaxID=572511 RepID=UPI000BA3EC1D|nr:MULTISPECIES: hypothetical protein [Blautia]
MNFIKFIEKKQKLKQKKKQEYIKLKKPVLNYFLGDYTKEEIHALSDTLEERVGGQEKIFYTFFNQESLLEEFTSQEFQNQMIEELEEKEYTLLARQALQVNIENSFVLEPKLQDFAIYVFNHASKVQFMHKGRIHVNIFVKADHKKACLLRQMTEGIRESFVEFYSSGCTIDVFLLLDQAAYASTEKGMEKKAFTYLTLKEAECMVREKKISMAYCMSNMNSQGILNREPSVVYEMLSNAALMTILKEGIPADVQGDYEAYKDEYMKMNASVNKGTFYSIGSFKLEGIMDVISLIVYRTVFLEMMKEREHLDVAQHIQRFEISREGINQFLNQIFPQIPFNELIWEGIIRNKRYNGTELANISAGDGIKKIYGRNLDLMLELNCVKFFETQEKEFMVQKISQLKNRINDLYFSENFSIFEICKVVNEMLSVLKEEKEHSSQMYEAELNTLKSWELSAFPLGQLKDKTEYSKDSKILYVLAGTYLQKKQRVLNSKARIQIVEQMEQGLRKVAEKYLAFADSVRYTAEELQKSIRYAVEDELELRVGNCENYYKMITEKILDTNENFKKFIRDVNQSIGSGNFTVEELFSEVLDFCEKDIFTRPEFHRDFSEEMLLRLKNYREFETDQMVYDFAFNTIMDNQIFMADQHGFMEPYKEVCFLINRNNLFVTATNQRMAELKESHRMKIFYENYYEDMDVLFIEGCFDPADLHAYDVYEKNYNRLAKQEGVYIEYGENNK